ncbi:MAG: hypothetical protein RL069_553, partial [Planctomycetota bacterium]
MHRALIRRIASERLVGSQKIQWSVFESDDPLVPALELGFDIHWFSVDVLRACCESTGSLGTGLQYIGPQCIGGKISSRGGVSEAH